MGGLEFSMCNHQCSSSTLPRGCLCGIHGLLLNIPSIDRSEMRYALPSGMTNEVWEYRPLSFF
jgi:hypothetical protein